MIKRTLKRTLSIFLTLVLIATTFFIFDPSVLKTDANAWVDVEASSIGSSLAAQTANAPETIYTRPGSNQFDLFSNLNVNTRAPGESTSSQGTVSFQNGKSTNVRIYVNNFWKKTAQNTYTEATIGTTLRLSSTNSSQFTGNPVAAKIDGTTAGGTSAASKASGATVIAGGDGVSSASFTFNNTQCQLNANDGEVYIVEWAVEYKIGSNYHYTFMYTGIFKQSLSLVGVTGYAYNTDIGDTPRVTAFAFITGAMGYANTGNRNCAYTGTVAGSMAAPLVQFVGQKNNSSSYSIPNGSDLYTSTTHFPTTTAGTGSVLVNGSQNKEDTFFATTYTSYGSYASQTITSSSNCDCTVSDGSKVGVAYMVVDTSRYSNYSQLPYLKVGFVRYYEVYGGYRARLNYIKGKDASLSSDVGVSATGVDTGDHADSGDNTRTYGLYQLSGSIYNGGFTVDFSYDQSVELVWGAGHRTATVHYGVGLHTTTVNKGSIRTAYCAGLTSNIDKLYYSGYSTYYTNMRTQARLLCDPTATSNTVSVSEATIDGVQDGLIASNTADVVTFYVPEAIYLNPSNMQSFQYYVDRANAKDGALRTGENTSGNVYLNVPGASSVSISYSGGSVTMGSTSGTDTISTTITGGSTSSAVSSGGTSVIEWTATFVIDGSTYTAKNYTVCYAPFVGNTSVAAAATSAKNTESTDFTVRQTTWVAGVHTVSAASSGDYKGSLPYDPQLYPTSYTSNTSSSKDSCFITSGTGTGVGQYWSSNDNVNYTGGSAGITIDTSRVTNLQHIPGLIVGMDFNGYHCDENYDSWVQMSLTGGGTTMFSKAKISARRDNLNQQVKGRYLATNKNISISSLSSITFTGTASGGRSDYTRNSVGNVTLTFTKVNKADLRTELNREIATGKQQAWYTSATWTNYKNALQNAATVLGNPKATTTDVTNARTNLGTTATALVRNTGTVSATHIGYGTNTITLGTDTSKTYNYGDTVSAGPNEYIGYEYMGFDGAEYISYPRSTNTGGGLASVTWSALDNSITIVSKASGSGGGTDNYNSNPNSSGSYYIPIQPDQDFELSYKVSGTPRVLVFEVSESNKDSWVQINETSAAGNKVTISGTANSNCNYLVVRFGNRAPGETTKFENINLKIGDSISSSGSLTRKITNCYNSTTSFTFNYIAKKYDVKYDPNGGTFAGETAIKTYEKVAEYDTDFVVGKTAFSDTSAQNPPTKTGYTFLNWSYNGNTYDNGETITPWKFDMDNVTFTAQWEAKNYNVKYDANEGSFKSGVTGDIGTFSYNESFNIPNQTDSGNIVSRTGYTLTGWSTKASGTSSDDIAFGSNCTVQRLVAASNDPENVTDVYVYAKWQINSHNVTLHAMTENANDANYTESTTGGTVSGGGTKNYGTALSITKSVKAGFVDNGWFSNSNMTNAATPATTMPDNDLSYWAKFTRERYTVNFNRNYNSSDSTVLTTWTSVKFGSTQTIPIPTRTGYKFNGWYAERACTNAKYEYNETTNNSTSRNVLDFGANNASVTLYAKWTANTITVSYAANGGGGSMTGNSFSYGSSYTPLANGFTTPTRTLNLELDAGSIPPTTNLTATSKFHGWLSSANDREYVAGETVYDNLGAGDSTNVTLTAQWEWNAITIPVPQRTGYDFDGWFTPGGVYVCGDKKNPVEYKPKYNGETLCAHWSRGTYSVILNVWGDEITDPDNYKSNIGGSVSVTGDGSFEYESEYTITATPNPGYKFVGWYSEMPQNGAISGTCISSDATYTTNMGVGANYWAIFKVVYCNVEAKAYSNTGSALTTWANNTTGGTVLVETNQSGTQGATSTGRIITGNTATLNAYPATGYHFAGWYDAAPTSSSGTALSTSSTWTNGVAFSSEGATITRYARFDINRNTLSVNPNGGTVNVGGQNYTSTQTFTQVGGTTLVVNKPTRTGYNFNGWDRNGTFYGTFPEKAYTKDAASATYVFNSSNNEVTDTITADWTAKTYKIYLNANNSNEAASDNVDMTYITKTYGTSIIIPDCTYKRTAYDFQGWSKTAGGSIAYGNNATINDEVCTIGSDGTISDGTLYGVWAIKTYTVTLAAKANTAAATGSFTIANVPSGCEVTATGRTETTFTVDHGTTFDITATSATGYSFAGWYNSDVVTGTAISTTNPYTVTITSNKTYYAKFTINTYTISVAAYANTAAARSTYTTAEAATRGCTVKINGGTTPVTAYYGETVTITATKGSGYTFQGWYKNVTPSSATADVAKNSDTSNYDYTITVGASNDTYNAKFTVNNLSLYVYAYNNATGTYENNATGGTVKVKGVSPSSTESALSHYVTQKFYYRGTYMVTAVPATGYTFDGWYSAVTGGSGATVTKWTTVKTGAVATDGNSSTFRKGSSGSEKLYAKFSITQKNLTVYAYSNTGTGSSTASYENNATGGTVQIDSGTAGATATTNKNYGSTAEIVATPTKVETPTGDKECYTFDGWYSVVTGGSGNTITAWTTRYSTARSALTAEFTDALKYYAKFTANSFTIALDPNGGTAGASSSVTAYYDSESSLTGTNPSKIGNEFLGWSTSSTATEATYAPNADLSVAEVNELFVESDESSNSITLYAVYREFTYTESVIAACNTGAAPSTYKVSTTGGTIAFNSGVTKIKPGEDILSKVTYSANTGYTFKEIRYGAVSSVPSSGSTISSTFGTYSTSASHAMQELPDNSTVVFVAFFEVNRFTVHAYAESENADGTFSNNTAGGSVKIDSGVAGATVLAYVYYGATTTFTATVKSGYTFAGWYNTSAMTGSPVSSSATYNVNLTDSVTYYAKFVIASYNAYGYAEYYTEGVNEATGTGTAGITGGTVTVAKTGTSVTTSSASPVSISAKFNQEVTYSATPATGYEFVGWYYSEGATYDDSINEGDIQLDYALETDDHYYVEMPDADIRIHAKFVPCNFILVFDPNGQGSVAVLGPTAAVTLTYNKGTTLDSTSIPTCSGKTFLGWSESSAATTPTYEYSNGNCTISSTIVNRWFGEAAAGNKTIYAIWQIANYVVTLDFDGGNGNANAQTSVENIAQGNDMPAISSANDNYKLPMYEGYQFAGYYTEPGGQGKKFYNADGTSAAKWDIADDATLYAKWICPVLKDATYDPVTDKWTYEYETTNGGTVTSTPDDETFNPQTITDKGLDIEGVKEITSRDRTETESIVNKNLETADINLNHYSQTSLSRLLSYVTATNTDTLRSALSQPELNAYVSKTAYYLNHTISDNQKTESAKPSIKLYESSSKVNSVKQKTITDPSDSASGATYDYPRSTDASSYVYSGKWSDVEGGAVDYFVYTNSTSPVIAIEIDDGDVLTTAEVGGSKTASSYPTKAAVSAKDSDGVVDASSVTRTSAVAATDNISEAWFAPYVEAGIGVGTNATRKEHDYNAKTILYLTPDFTSENASGTVNEVVYTITPSDDAYVGKDGSNNVVNNSGFQSSEIANVSSSLASRFGSFTNDIHENEDDTKDSITVCISYHNAMNGTSDEGGAAGDPYLQVYTDQVSHDTWLNQMHLFRTSGGADNWELPLTAEDVYPVDDATYRNNNGYILGSFAYIFDANTEPAAAERAYNDDFTAAKDIIINSIKGNLSSAYENISTHSFYSYSSSDDNSGLGMFAIKGWSTNYYPRPNSYVYVHLVDRWGNVFNRVWKNFKIDANKPKITGTASTSFTVNETGGSNIATFSLADTDVTFIPDIDSTYENNVYTTSGNSFVIDTGKPATKLQLAVTDNAGNVISGKIPTNKQGLITFNVNDDCADLTDGAYTFMFNDTEVNLWAREPALVRSTEMSASSVSGEPCTFTIKTMDNATKIQLVENGSTRTYTPDMSNVTVVDNGDGTLSWTVKMNPLSLGEHTFQIRCKDKSGVWNDCDFTLSTTVSPKTVIKEEIVQMLSDTSCYVDERAVLELTTLEGTQAVRVMYDNGYSKTVSRSDDVVVSCVDGLEVWRITAGSFSSVGEYTASAYVKYNDTWYKSDVATCTITVTKPAKAQAIVLAVTPYVKEVKSGEKATFEILTNKATEKLQFVLPSDTWTVTPDNATVTDNGDGTLTWIVNKSFGTIGENEIILKAKSSAGWTEAETYCTVNVVK